MVICKLILLLLELFVYLWKYEYIKKRFYKQSWMNKSSGFGESDDICILSEAFSTEDEVIFSN